MFMGFKAFGGGSFERRGSNAMVGLLAAFFVVCVLEGVAGWLLWGGHTSGAILALALVPIGAFFWWGFALPIPPLFAVARTDPHHRQLAKPQMTPRGWGIDRFRDLINFGGPARKIYGMLGLVGSSRHAHQSLAPSVGTGPSH